MSIKRIPLMGMTCSLLWASPLCAKDLKLLMPPISLSKSMDAEYSSVLQAALLNEVQKGSPAQIFEVAACGDCQKVLEAKNADLVLRSELGRLGKAWTLSAKLYNKQGQVKFSTFKMTKNGEDGLFDELLTPAIGELKQSLVALNEANQVPVMPVAEIKTTVKTSSSPSYSQANTSAPKSLGSGLGAWSPVESAVLDASARRALKLNPAAQAVVAAALPQAASSAGSGVSFNPSALFSWVPSGVAALNLGAPDERRKWKMANLGSVSLASSNLSGAALGSSSKPVALNLTGAEKSSHHSAWVKWTLYGISALSAGYAYYEQDRVWNAMDANKQLALSVQGGSDWASLEYAQTAMAYNQSLMKKSTQMRNYASILSGLSFSTSLAFFTF